MSIREIQRTRSALLKLLKKYGRQDAFSLSRRLGLTPMAVRLHLYRLAEEGYLSYEEVPGPIGRPAKLWQLTNDAAHLFPDRYLELTLELLEGVKGIWGDDGLERLLDLLGREQKRRYGKAVDRKASLRERLKGLCRARTEEGYMAELVRSAEPGGHLIAQSHCPILSAASHCKAICDAELRMFQQTLGSAVVVERFEHVLSGGARCTYRVSERASAPHKK